MSDLHVPWTISGVTGQTIRDAQGRAISTDSHGPEYADWKKIVLAVNCHDDLVKAVEAMLSAVESGAFVFWKNEDMEIVRAAINKAKGNQT